jgi:hypothetical protein
MTSNEQLYDKAIDFVVKALHEQGRDSVTMAEWQQMVDARLAGTGWAPIKKGKAHAKAA